MTDLAELLERAAEGERPNFSTTDVQNRVRRRARRRWTIASGLMTIAVVAAFVTIVTWNRSDDGESVIAGETNEEPRPATPGELIGEDWVATAFDPPTPEGVAILPTFEFTVGSVGGRGGCNFFGMDWYADVEGRIRLNGFVTQTSVGCLPPYDKVEESLFSLLESDPSVTITDSGAVSLSAGDRSITLERLTDLGSMPSTDQVVGRWEAADDTILTFAGSSLAVDACEFGPWIVEDGRVLLNEPLPPPSCLGNDRVAAGALYAMLERSARLYMSSDGRSLYAADDEGFAVVLRRSR